MLDFGCNVMCSMYVCMYVCMCLTRCHEFLFPATKGHLPRRATFAPNRRWPLVAGTTVAAVLDHNFEQCSKEKLNMHLHLSSSSVLVQDKM